MPMFHTRWYVAVQCADDHDQQQVFLHLSQLFAHVPDLNAWQALRLVTTTHRLVIVIQPSPTSVASPSQQAEIAALLGTRPRVQLPPDLLTRLVEPVSAAHDENRVWEPFDNVALLYIHTAPSLVRCGPLVPSAEEEHSPPSQQDEFVSASPVSSGSPPSPSPFSLIDRVRQQGERSVFALLVPYLLDEMAPCFRLLIDEAEHLLFTLSAEQMHADIRALLDMPDLTRLEGQQQVEKMAAETLLPLLQGSRSLLIMFEQPHRSPIGVIHGLLLHPCFPLAVLHEQEPQQIPARLELILQLARFRGFWNLDLLGEDGPLLRGGWNPLLHRWQAEEEETTFFHWLSWLVITIRMVRRQYARTPEPPPFPHQEYALREQVLLPRHHGKGKPKRKWVEQRVRVTTITYEVSLRHEQPFEEALTPPALVIGSPAAPKRSNWLTQAAPEDLIYEQREIEPHTRRYPQRKDGTRRAGSVDVTYKEPKWVPMLKPGKRKMQIRKRVVSQRHQVPPAQAASIDQAAPTSTRDARQAERE